MRSSGWSEEGGDGGGGVGGIEDGADAGEAGAGGEGGGRHVDAVVDEEERAGARGDLAKRRGGERERAPVERLGAQLHGDGTGRRAVERALDLPQDARVGAIGDEVEAEGDGH